MRPSRSSIGYRARFWTLLRSCSRRKGWALVALDVGVDTTTPQGEMVAKIMDRLTGLTTWAGKIA